MATENGLLAFFMDRKELVLVLALALAAYSIGVLSAEQVLPKQGQGVLAPLPPKEFAASVDIVAVRAQGEVGVVNTATVEVKPGKGRVLFALNPFVEPDTQQSAEIAASVAEQLTKKSLAEKDVIYSIDAGDVQLVGGPSAGAALTIATIAAIEEKDLNESVGITGTIQADGSIGQIGGVLEKAAAEADANKTLFLVPAGQSTITYYEKQVQEERRGNLVIQRVNYVPKKLDLNDFARQQQWDLRIAEVSGIEEALGYFLI
jgi:uncharacterized protein